MYNTDKKFCNNDTTPVSQRILEKKHIYSIMIINNQIILTQ